MTQSFMDLTQDDVTKMIIAQAHLGHRSMETSMKTYIHGRQAEGTYIFNIEKTYAKIQLAARMIVAIKNPQDIVLIGAREESLRGINKFCRHTGCNSITGRFMPGTFTNRQSPSFIEPQLIIVNDPTIDHQAILESSYANIPVVALCNSDSKLSYVDVAIPCNNKGKRSVGLMYWMLCREVLRMRGDVKRDVAWNEMPDTFIQLTEEDIKKMENPEEEEAVVEEEAPKRQNAPKKEKKDDFQEESDPFADK